MVSIYILYVTIKHIYCIYIIKHFFRGLKFFAKNRTERVKALAESLIKNGYDVVCLQELWCDSDYKYLKESCENIFKYIHYFHRYVKALIFNKYYKFK